MKIHTVRKYLSQLPKDPPKNLFAHYKILSDAVCKALNIRAVNSVTLMVAGQDSDYTATAVSQALKNAGVSSATIDFNVLRSPETALTVNCERLPADVISRIMTVIRTVERTLVSKPDEDFSRPCVYEVFLLGALCACSEMGVSHIILQLGFEDMPSAITQIIPQAKIIHCNEIFPSEAELVKFIARKGVEVIISAPQQKDSRKALYSLCNELNCNHAVVARGEIEIGTPGFRGIPFKYRNFNATAGTQLPSAVALSATALLTVRELSKLRVKVTDNDAYESINFRKIPGRGEIISVRPYTLCCTYDHADVLAVENIVTDMRLLICDRRRRADIILEAAADIDSELITALLADIDIEPDVDKVVIVGAIEHVNPKIASVSSFSSALESFPYLKDSAHLDDHILIVIGSAEFQEKNASVLSDAVRDDFSY